VSPALCRKRGIPLKSSGAGIDGLKSGDGICFSALLPRLHHDANSLAVEGDEHGIAVDGISLEVILLIGAGEIRLLAVNAEIVMRAVEEAVGVELLPRFDGPRPVRSGCHQRDCDH
jgi:hypothetical protein